MTVAIRLSHPVYIYIYGQAIHAYRLTTAINLTKKMSWFSVMLHDVLHKCRNIDIDFDGELSVEANAI